MKIPASATILTRNSAATLERCLVSVQDFADIVVLDGNSTDGTPDIARQFGARVIPQTDSKEPAVRITNFPEVREKSFRETTYDWVYMIDSDEWASPEQIEAVRTLVAANRVREVYLFRKLAVVDDKVVRYAYFYPDYSLRMLAKSGGAHWRSGRLVHEKIIIPDGVTRVRRNEVVFSAWPPFAQSVEKDAGYLAMAIAPYQKEGVSRLRCLRVAVLNTLKAVYILARIAAVHLRYGFRDTMPLRQHLRFPRYHWTYARMLVRRALTIRSPYAPAR